MNNAINLFKNRRDKASPCLNINSHQDKAMPCLYSARGFERSLIKKYAGFALFEVMIAAILLCVIVIGFMYVQSINAKKQSAKVVGKNLSIVINNTLLKAQTEDKAASSGTLLTTYLAAPTKDYSISRETANSLKNAGYDINTATIEITTP
jgi:Tfp pilus assembly major pilin PilA